MIAIKPRGMGAKLKEEFPMNMRKGFTLVELLIVIVDRKSTRLNSSHGS